MPVRHDPRTGKFMGGAGGFKASVKGGGSKSKLVGVPSRSQSELRRLKEIKHNKSTAKTLKSYSQGRRRSDAAFG